MPRVLVCEDDAGIRALIGLTLGDHYEVEFAENGREALDAAVGGKERKPTVYDGIIMDVMMPEVDGFEALRRLRLVTTTADVPVIMLTAKVQEDDYLQGFSFGADAYVSKPFDPAVLLETVDEVLGRSPERRRAIREEELAKATLLRRLEQRFEQRPAQPAG